MDWKKKLSESLQRAKSAASKGVERAESSDTFKTIKSAAETSVRRADEKFQNYRENRTSWGNGDSITELEDSDNPLINLHRQKVAKHAKQAAIYFAVASQVFVNADEISRFTRDLMDKDSAAVQQWLRRVFNPEEAKEISAWMDAAPGYETAGGWAHRLAHGHDLDAMFTLVNEYGYTGGLEWANHVMLRDFWTPHGVPYLPTGSSSIYEWLVNQDVAPSTAMSVLTINAAELASGLLLFSSFDRISSGLKSYAKIRRYKNALAEINDLVDQGLYNAALDRVADIEIRIDWDDIQSLRMDLALLCLRLSYAKETPNKALWGNKAYTIAENLCRVSSNFPESIPYHGGTRVSFTGLAATIMASSYASHVQQTRDDSEINHKVEFGIRRLLDLAEKLSKKRKISLGDKSTWGYRPYSAATNLLLALDLSINYGSLHKIDADPMAIRRRLLQVLSEIEEVEAQESSLANRVRQDIERVYPASE